MNDRGSKSTKRREELCIIRPPRMDRRQPLPPWEQDRTYASLHGGKWQLRNKSLQVVFMHLHTRHNDLILLSYLSCDLQVSPINPKQVWRFVCELLKRTSLAKWRMLHYLQRRNDGSRAFPSVGLALVIKLRQRTLNLKGN